MDISNHISTSPKGMGINATKGLLVQTFTLKEGVCVILYSYFILTTQLQIRYSVLGCYHLFCLNFCLLFCSSIIQIWDNMNKFKKKWISHHLINEYHFVLFFNGIYVCCPGSALQCESHMWRILPYCLIRFLHWVCERAVKVPIALLQASLDLLGGANCTLIILICQ